MADQQAQRPAHPEAQAEQAVGHAQAVAEPESEDTSVRQVAWRQQADQQEQRVELPDGIHRRQAE